MAGGYSPTKMANVLLLDPEVLVRTLLKGAIDNLADFHVVAEAGDDAEALSYIESSDVDLVLTEYGVTGMSGVELIKEFKKRRARAAVVVLSSMGTAASIKQALLAGAQGYILKGGSWEDLKQALRYALDGRTYISSQVESLPVPRNYYCLEGEGGVADPLSELTPREKEIFHLLAVGIQTKDIAKRLYISPRTVEVHRARIAKKLGISTGSELVRFALRHGLTSL